VALIGDVDSVWHELIFFHFISFVCSECPLSAGWDLLGSRGWSGGMKCGHSAQRGNFFPLVKHKANLSLDVILLAKFSKSYTASSTAA
jgi:hypothetical protein